MRKNGSIWLSARKWMILATVLTGTAFQLTSCSEEASYFGLRTAFSSVFLPINQLIVFFANIIGSSFVSI